MQNFWLRWAGSKRRAVPALRSIFENHDYNFYVDPFIGAGTIFFMLAKPVNAVLSDSNADLISFYRFLKRKPLALWRQLSYLPFRFSTERYKDIRGKFNELPKGIERAATFFFLNRTCFNGIYRVNRVGKFNVPMGSRREFRFPSLEVLQGLSKKLQRAKIVKCDFAQTSVYARKGALYYLDPPYTGIGNSRSFDRYSWPPFRKPDLDRLQSFILNIGRHKADVIISYSGHKAPWFVPPEYSIKRFNVYRSISGDGTRGNKAEICAYQR